MAEFPGLGRHCGVELCNQLDFLPITCDACRQSFCNSHFTYASHGCSVGHRKDVQVPVCPLCAQPVPTPRGQLPDIAVNDHINNNCSITKKRKIFNNQCSVQGCKKRELVPVRCPKCSLNYCLRHRHESDHECHNNGGRNMSYAAIAALARSRQENSAHKHVADAALKRQMAADEELARRLASGVSLTPEELDRRLAEQLQMEENRRTVAPAGGRSHNNGCSLS